MGVKKKNFISNWKGISIPTPVAERSCLVVTSNHLISTGGIAPVNGVWRTFPDVQTYNLNTELWDNILPNLPSARSSHSCNFVSDTEMLYVIGGSDNIIKINVYASGTLVWFEISDTYLRPSIRSVLYNEWIIVVGDATNSVYLFNTETDELSLSTERLPYAIYQTSAIIVDDVLYAFGGYSAGGAVDTWMKLDLLTSFPTAQPSEYPSHPPSFMPSNGPTISDAIAYNPKTSTSTTQSNKNEIEALEKEYNEADIDEIVENTLTAKDLDVDFVETNIDSNGDIVVLIVINSDSNLSTDTIKNEISETLEEEYGQDVEIIVNVKKEGEKEENPSEQTVFSSVIILIMCCCLLFTFWRFHKNKKSKKQSIANLEMTSKSVISSISDIEPYDDHKRKEQNTRTPNGISMHNEAPQINDNFTWEGRDNLDGEELYVEHQNVNNMEGTKGGTTQGNSLEQHDFETSYI